MSEAEFSKESRLVQFSFLVLFGVLSIPCSLYIFYSLYKYPSFRRRFHYQTLFLLVFLVTMNTLFNIPTMFRYSFRQIHLNYIHLLFGLVFMLADVFYIEVLLSVVFGRRLIIFLQQVSSGLKQFLLRKDIF